MWLAIDALPIHLVDSLGSLNDAVKKAAQLAKVDEYYTATYPEPDSWMDNLLPGNDDKGSYLDGELRVLLGDAYEPFVEARTDQQRNRLQARLPFGVRMK